ncbi:golgin subfamily A member 6-like protein 22 isoform X2 [Actinia tenebrosa]|uniref:Golgin subfamily A member 6-like protein 22 isoform X2 n=1 Tax=Actinia tenebrosa TaxID=6105 RepID=A0A6P8HGG3_ACTTE|nr:golgin subfamily A member 6-like protein 22 isoform X2 [Actinia tenebrosa]
MASLNPNNEHRAKMISELMSDKENLLAGVNSVLTPGRRPLKPVQENTVITPEVFSNLKKRIVRTSLTPSGLSQKSKTKSKRLSIPVHVFRKNLKQNTKVRKPFSLPLSFSKVEEEKITEESPKCETEIPDSGKHKSVVEEVVENVEQSPEKNEEKEEEKELDLLAESVVKQVFKDIADSTKKNLEKESYERKIQEFTQIILQMNKERLDLEKQLSVYKKEQVQPSRTKEKSANAKDKRYKESKNNLGLEKKLSQKTKEIQQLKRELQQAQPGGKKSKAHPEKELEAKKEEVKQLKIELNQLQHQVREVPGLKNELQKSRQQVSQLNDISFACRRENNNQKTLIAKIQKELTSKETRANKHLEECEKNTKALQNELSEKKKMVLKLSETAQKFEHEIKMYKIQSDNICRVVERLEAVAIKAQNFKSAAERKVKDLSSSLNAKEQLCKSLKEQLESSRNESTTYMQECEHLKAQVNALNHEVDVGHLEISRQQGVITSLEERLEKLRVENCQYQDQLELVQVQQQEINEFMEEEKRTLEETTREMEKELEETRHKGMKLDETFRETTVRCVELEHEVKLSRGLYLEKQDELDATQSQAHCIMFQLQNEITDAQEAIGEIWGVLDALLMRFREEAKLGCFEAHNQNVNEEEKCHTQAPAPRSLVQSVLSAVAKGSIPEGPEDSYNDDQPSFTLCSQISELKQGLLELAQIGHGQSASEEARQKIAELEQNSKSMELSNKRLVHSLQSELDTCRARESDMQEDMERQNNEIDYLNNTLDNTKEQLKQTMRENHSLSHLLDVEAEQKQTIKSFKNIIGE